MTSQLAAVPDSERWRPTRAGLVGLWRYWDETFVFHRGRLLLRGPNGAGKSMALELLLPFLLDGDSSPARLTSAAKSRGRLYDRLMSGVTETSRTGFAWVEFRRGEDVFTAGTRLRASQSSGKVDVDLFTTSLAVGRDLHLLDESRTPLSRRALVEAIGDTGRVHGSADEHRAAVREVLFPGFSADRYASVLTALLALRKEKLSQNLDLDKLSDVLSEALPPLDDQDIATVAEGFERLDRRRGELAALERDLGEVKSLVRRQRDYARAVVVRAARDVRSAESERDQVTRREREARETLAAAELSLAALGEEAQTISDRQEAIGIEIEALKDSQAYREGSGLVDLHRQSEQLAGAAERARRVAEQRAEELRTAAAERQATETRREEATSNLEVADRDLRAHADPLGAAVMVDEAAAADDPDSGERLARAWIASQRERIEKIDGALTEHELAVARRDDAERQVAAGEQRADHNRDALVVARASLDGARETYAASVADWVAGCHHLADELRGALPRPADDPPAVAAAVDAAFAAVSESLGADQARIDSRRTAFVEQHDALIEERGRWEHDEAVEAEAPAWRADRTDRAGAPLWRLVDVRDGIEDADLGRLEAALTGAGLIDAWLAPDGALDLGTDRADVMLTRRPCGGRTLASLLEPVADAIVGADAIGDVLASIAIVGSALEASPAGETDVLIGTDGTYRLGAATGRGPTRPAMLLGAPARERHRLARLAGVDREIAEVDRRLADLDREQDALDRRRAAIGAEVAAAPSGAPVEEAAAAVSAATARLDEATEALESARDQRRRAEDAVRQALRDLSSLAALHGLPAQRDELRDIDRRIDRLADAVATWTRRRREEMAAARALVQAAERETSAVIAAESATRDLIDAERQLGDHERRLATLESSVGAEYAAVLERIAALDTERATGAARRRDVDAELLTLNKRSGILEEQVTAAATRRAEAEVERDRTQRLLTSALTAFRGDLDRDLLEQPETATAILAAARAIAADHEDVATDGPSVERTSEHVNNQLHQAESVLGARVDLDRDLTEDGWWVLRATAGGIRRTATELMSMIGRELEAGRGELAAEEEQLFERTLAGGVRRSLADRIRAANALTDAINAQLGAVRTAAGGVAVRLRWDVDPEQAAAVKEARSLLLRDPADLSEDDRTALQDFVRARVDQARAELEANAPWEARLRETLDYRAWHRFSLQISHRDWEGYEPATARRLQRLSTGERSIVLHLPMIASVAAHYAGGGRTASTCPRLILLDELFAGVDVANRAQLFGAFTDWDLDAVFTSDAEWCQYATLDGIAIHHLHPPIGDEPVTSTRFTWDGRRRVIDPTAA